MKERETLGSRLGFILLSAGCAIGVGNVWRFPYITGQYGGGFFVLVYVLFLAILGIPIMTMEYAMGRATKRSILPAYRLLEPKGSHWHLISIHGRQLCPAHVLFRGFGVDLLLRLSHDERHLPGT